MPDECNDYPYECNTPPDCENPPIIHEEYFWNVVAEKLCEILDALKQQFETELIKYCDPITGEVGGFALLVVTEEDPSVQSIVYYDAELNQIDQLPEGLEVCENLDYEIVETCYFTIAPDNTRVYYSNIRIIDVSTGSNVYSKVVDSSGNETSLPINAIRCEEQPKVETECFVDKSVTPFVYYTEILCIIAGNITVKYIKQDTNEEVDQLPLEAEPCLNTTPCEPFISSFYADSIPPTINPYNSISIDNQSDCKDCIVTINTSAGNFIVGAGRFYSPDKFDCCLTSLTATGGCLDKVLIYIQNTGNCE